MILDAHCRAFEFFGGVCRRGIYDNLNAGVSMPDVVLQECVFNLSAGGIGILLASAKRPVQLSLLLIEFDEGSPVCVLAEPVWDQPVDDGLCCGFRFFHIHKTDQERISSCVRSVIRKSGGTYIDFKRNWVLLDKMATDDRKP